MGIFDAVKSRLGRGNKDEYEGDDQYYEDEEYYDEGSQDGYEESYDAGYEESYQEGGYYDDAGEVVRGASTRNSSVFDTYTPLVSASDIRSQELPSYTPGTSRTRTQQSEQPYKTSLPYIDESNERGTVREAREPREDSTGRISAVRHDPTRVYGSENSEDPLLKRHSLSNTGDFSATSPAYYASRSGVGHVRPAGQARRNHKFREAVVIRPESYAEAEQIATNLRRGNAVVLVLTQTRPELAKRILDFSFGAAAVSEGQVVSIGERVYALTVDHALTDTELELLQARGVL